MHNLSRPENTPLGLLKKTVQKGRDQYLELFEFEDIGDDIRTRYMAKLAEVDKGISWSDWVTPAPALKNWH